MTQLNFPPKVCLLDKSRVVIDQDSLIEEKLFSYLKGVSNTKQLANLLSNNRAHNHFPILKDLASVRSLELTANAKFSRPRYRKVWEVEKERGLSEKFLGDVLTTLAVYESCLERGWASRTFKMIASRGIRVALSKLIKFGERRQGYALLKEKGLLEFSFESFVKRNQEYFE